MSFSPVSVLQPVSRRRSRLSFSRRRGSTMIDLRRSQAPRRKRRLLFV